MANISSFRPHVYRHFHRIAWLAVALAACVIVFGAFVRLSNAGLSCPDWPTCYGKVAWPTAAEQVSDHAATAIRPVMPDKAWREQFHRMIAGSLGLLVFVLALLATRKRPQGWLLVMGAAALVAAAIPMYMRGAHVASSIIAATAELLLLAGVVRWSNTDLARASTLTLAVIIFQALLGMWTVTWLLKPVVVMGHLLGGLTTFALLSWMAWRATGIPMLSADAPKLRCWLGIGLFLVVVQIALGGWTSANYAALACGADFPTCAGAWWPAHDFKEAFVLWRGIGVDYEGGILDNTARVAIQLTHRFMAVVVACYVLLFSAKLLRIPGLRNWGVLLALLIVLQFGLGVSNVLLGLPLPVAVLHNAGATAVLFVLVTLLARIRLPEA